MSVEKFEHIKKVEPEAVVTRRYKKMIYDAMDQKEKELGRKMDSEEIGTFLAERAEAVRSRAWEEIREKEKTSPLTSFEKLRIIRENDGNRYWDTLKDIEDTKASGFLVSGFSNVERWGVFEIKDGQMRKDDRYRFDEGAADGEGRFFESRDEAKRYAEEKNREEEKHK